MPFLNFGSNKNKHFNLSDMNFFMKNMKNKYSDPDPLWNRIRIHFFQCGSEDPDPDPLLRKGGSENLDPDPLFPNVDPRIRIRTHVKMSWIRNAGTYIPSRSLCLVTYLLSTNILLTCIHIFLIHIPMYLPTLMV